jgi:predicted DNA-binding transcriptional regulator AlpA
MDPNHPLAAYLTSDEVCAILGVHSVTLYRWHRLGVAPPRIETSPRRFVYSKGAFAAWVIENASAISAARNRGPVSRALRRVAAASPATPAPAIRCLTRTRPAPSNT